MLIQLPNGLLDGVDLFNYCEIDELRGKQQNYLANAQLVVNNIGHVPKILGDMVLSFQTKEGRVWKGDKKLGIEKLCFGDIETILVKVREKTYGPKFYHEAYCDKCAHHHTNLRLDLDKLELDLFPVEKMLNTTKLTLPKSQLVVELRPQYMKDLFEAIKLNTDNQEKLVTEAIKLNIKTIDGKEFTSEAIENIPVSDLKFLNDEAEKVKLEGTIDTTIEITCQNCEKDFKVKLNVIKSDFFSPSGGTVSLNI